MPVYSKCSLRAHHITNHLILPFFPELWIRGVCRKSWVNGLRADPPAPRPFSSGSTDPEVFGRLFPAVRNDLVAYLGAFIQTA
jgi:hypothetical protein